MKIIYLPLDERPCNYQYPYDIAQTNDEIEIVRPRLEQLGVKKKPAQTSDIFEFLNSQVTDGATIICSIDMVVYGGLIPSRIHHQQYQQLVSNLEKLKQLKLQYNLKVYAFSSIMRTPSYSSSDEEPDYYQQYGQQIYKRKILLDKIERLGTNHELESKLKAISIPDQIISDYEQRRQVNLAVNNHVLQQLAEGVFEHLVIFQDDSAPFGYTAIDQKQVKDQITALNLQSKVDIYPGADEVGCSLLARAYNQKQQRNNKLFVEYSSVNGPGITPLYEDRPMFETLKSHVDVTTAIVVDTSIEADMILMVNSPGELMQESWDQFTKRDRTYDSHRNLKAFVSKIKYYIDQGKRVAIADCAYANGCDLELVRALDDNQLLDKVIAYTGWNTHANTLGTVISAMQVAPEINHQTITNTLTHVLEAGFYQAKVRIDINLNTLPMLGLNYFDLKDKQAQVIELELMQLKQLYEELKVSHKYPLRELNIRHPWNRMFEIEVKIKI